MDRSSTFIWRAARSQFNLPDCPDDLSEPAYANLAFYARCHACDKYTTAILWRIRRRYCTECRDERLCRPSYWPEVIYGIIKMTAEYSKAEDSLVDKAQWPDLPWSLAMDVSCHDKEHVHSLMRAYKDSSDKEQFLSEKRKQYSAIYAHAKKCEIWQEWMAFKRKNELESLRQERYELILERLKELGYEREINYFGPDRFRESRKMTSKLLTDKEWARILPKWLETMNHHRRLRVDATVHRPRRLLLESEYNYYVRHRSPDTPIFDLLPHVADLARFPPFRDIIMAPDGTPLGEKPFASAFAQLPVLVEEWKKQLDADLTELIRIPPRLYLQDASSRQVVASSSATSAEPRKTDLDKLHLACAIFGTSGGSLYMHPEVFLTSMLDQKYPGPALDEDVSMRGGSILDRFGVRFFEEAPYIVHACGLDPSVATADDMDQLMARLRCVACDGTNTMNWRDAMLHAHSDHQTPLLAPLSESPRWQRISDASMYIDTLAVKKSSKKKRSPQNYRRCLLCQPRVGDAVSDAELKN
ncbi:hypothetical protein OG21DRAFT_1449427, partial [Imleria badia]